MRASPRFFALFFCALLTLNLVPASSSAAETKNFEITPFVGYRFGGDFDIEGSDASYKLNDSESYGLLFNVRASGNTQWEVLYSRQRSDARLAGSSSTSPLVDTDMQILQLGGTYQGDGEMVRPYLAMTLGGTHIKTTTNGSQSDTFFSGSIGLGLNMFPGKRVALRVEARAYGTLMNSNTSLFCQTGPDSNVCAIRIEGSLLSQLETFAGIVFRF
jgi:hypothetical protein